MWEMEQVFSDFEDRAGVDIHLFRKDVYSEITKRISSQSASLADIIVNAMMPDICD